MNRGFFLLVLVLSSFGCYEEQSGCLDPLAMNYDVSADDPGPCNYPDMVLDLVHAYDTLLFAPGRVFTPPGVDSIRVDTFQCILSDFALLNEEGKWETVSDRRSIMTGDTASGETKRVRDDIVLFNPAFSNATVGTFARPGGYDSLRFQTGLPSSWQNVFTSSLPTGHPLNRIPGISLEQNPNAHAYLKLRIWRNPVETIQSVLQFDPRKVRLSRGTPLNVEAGEEATVSLRTDYEQWMESVDWANDSKAEIINKLEAALPESFQWIDE